MGTSTTDVSTRSAFAVGHFDATVFTTTYLPIPAFFLLLLGYKIVMRTQVVKYQHMDFVTDKSDDIPLDVRQTLAGNFPCTALVFDVVFANCERSQPVRRSGRDLWTTSKKESNRGGARSPHASLVGSWLPRWLKYCRYFHSGDVILVWELDFLLDMETEGQTIRKKCLVLAF